MDHTVNGDDALLDTIIPVIDSVLRRRRRALRCSEEDIEDIRASVLTRIFGRLRGHAGRDIISLRDYVAVATYRATDEFFRRTAPQRHVLKTRIRYILRCDQRLLAWEIGRLMVAGLAEWRGVSCYVDDLNWEALPLEVTDSTKPIPAVYAAISAAGCPVALDALVSMLAEAWQITGRSSFAPRERDFDDAIIGGIDGARRLGRIWDEIRMLPLGQRRALLLNLRDDDGMNALTSFLTAGVTTIEELSAAVELDLVARWHSLPLSDNDLAAMLDITRQQVINLRLAARRRLRRHLQPRVALSVHEHELVSGSREECP